MIRLDDLALFCRVAELGSFTAAANEVDIAPAQVSACIRRLEEELATPLFLRTTRKVTLTPEGERYLPHAVDILVRTRDSAARLRATEEEISGEVHVAVPSDLGRHTIGTWLPSFRNANPAIRIRVSVSDDQVDLFKEKIDAVIRYGVLSDSNFVAMPLVPLNRRVLVAAPSFIAANGQPDTVEALPAFPCLAWTLRGRTHDAWRFANNVGETIHVSPIRVSNDAEVVRRWALAGEGIAYKSWLDVADDVAAGRLAVVLPTSTGESLPLTLVCAHRRQFSPAVRRLYAMLGERFAEFLKRRPLPGTITH